MRDHLIKQIMKYESDTFSAFGAKITEEEAEAVLDLWIDMQWNRIDGVQIEECLNTVREYMEEAK